MPFDNVQSGDPLTRTRDRMSCCPPDSTPPPPHSSESGVEFDPPLRVGGSKGRKYNPCISVLSKTYSCNLKKLPQLRYSLTTWRYRGRQESEQHFLNGPQSPGKVHYTVVYKTTCYTNNTIHDGLHPWNYQCFLFADWLNIAY